MIRQKEEGKSSLLPYTTPSLRIEKISASFFRSRSLAEEELAGFNLLAATDTSCDDY